MAKLNEQDKKLIETARNLLFKVRKELGMPKFGQVTSALISKEGKIYTGTSINLNCGLGICGERTALAHMCTEGKTEINTIVAVGSKNIYPPCGPCREFMIELNKKNLDAEVIVEDNKKIKLKELMPFVWQEVQNEW